MLESEVTDRGQTTLPEEVLEAMSLGEGGRIRYIITDGAIRMVAVKPVARLFGALQYDGPPMTEEEMERAVSEGAAGTSTD
ncbi:MAG: AbrB family transcriptional regulator [Chloroflexi bacterium]|nr:AbrB family transcriptional regulator [Chloroflexota bacterium]